MGITGITTPLKKTEDDGRILTRTIPTGASDGPKTVYNHNCDIIFQKEKLNKYFND